ncbi:MAG: ABC transporter ATP-binding protein [Gammaproteobacteria bacterium]
MIEYQHVTKFYRTGKKFNYVLDNINFSVSKGNIVVLLGPSGCGKSTLLRLTNRMETLTSGTIKINDQDITSASGVQLRRKIGYVIQQIGLFPNKTVAQNIGMIPKVLQWDKEIIEQRVRELLAMVRLDPEIYFNRYPAQLSGGQQQRVGVARALAADPEVLLMDEPFGAVDPVNREKIQDEFLRLQNKLKKTILFVSHDIQEAIKMADYIAIFKDGKIQQYDTPEIILTQPENEFVADFVGADAALKMLSLIRVRDALDENFPHVITAEMPLQQIQNYLTQNKVNFLVVTEDNKPIGFIPPSRVYQFRYGRAKDIMRNFSVFLETRTTLREALSEMLAQNTTQLCVVDDEGNFAGMMSYKNIQATIQDIYGEDN